MFDAVGIPVEVHRAGLFAGMRAEHLAALRPGAPRPVLHIPKGTVVQDSLAIAETLTERRFEAGLWPEGSKPANARWLVAEMHSDCIALGSVRSMDWQRSGKSTRPRAVP